jgi:hypothetical protein
MATQAAALKLTTQPNRESTVTYFGLTVEVLERMEQCSLIHYRDRKFVVRSDDLQEPRVMALVP